MTAEARIMQTTMASLLNIDRQPAVMISIKSIWGEKILNGFKLEELRKTYPNLELPFKAYIYCTKQKPYLYKEANGDGFFLDRQEYRGDTYEDRFLSGKVVGEFICDKITRYDEQVISGGVFYSDKEGVINEDLCEEAQLDNFQLLRYGKGKPLYGWHISDLKIYDKPKELSEFRGVCAKYHTQRYRNGCIFEHCKHKATDSTGIICEKPGLIKAPQSWCYVIEA